MAAIVYLDVDDEITSAAARIRSLDAAAVALVVPYGSRLATSRINFRLLAREADAHGRKLAVVTADPGSRALAASAGLPAFASVGEYEQADGGHVSSTTRAADASPAVESRDTPTRPAPLVTAPTSPRSAAPSAADTILIPPVSTEELDLTDGSLARSRREHQREERAQRRANSSLPVVTAGRRLAIPSAALVGGALLAVALVAVGVGAYVFLPSATVVVRPTPQVVGPVSVDVRADPAVTAVDAAAAVVPAQRLTFDVEAADTFPASGKRVESAAASGGVTFDSINTVGPVRVPEGTRVSTLDGVVFLTTEAVTVPAAKVAGSRIDHGFVDAPVRAQREGPAGNVEPGDIVQVPGFLDTQQVSVTNRAATSGGVRNEFPKVVQEDVDKALADLATRIADAWASRLADPESVPEGATLFAETASLEPPAPTTDPATLVGLEQAEFQLGMHATGSVTAVNESPVSSIAEQRLRAALTPGYRLVAGSIDVTPGAPTVSGPMVTFPVVARASEIRVPEASVLRQEIKGLPIPEARARLAQYGDVDVDSWPDWASSIPTLDFRLDLRVETDVEMEDEAVVSPSPS